MDDRTEPLNSNNLQRLGILLTLAVTLLTAPGCQMFRQAFGLNRSQSIFQTVLPPDPSLDQVVTAVNNNSRQIQSFTTRQASVSSDQLPMSLRNTTISFERPRRVRIQAGIAPALPSELDLGSNDELFWMWVRQSPDHETYYCRHDQFSQCPVRHMMPIDPNWLVEAIGIVEFLPDEQHEGPFPRKGGQLMIRTTRSTSDGPVVKLTIIEPATALVQAQYMYDPQGNMVASAVVYEHRLEPMSGVTLPRIVELTSSPKGQQGGMLGKVRINLGNVQVNPPQSEIANLFSMPDYSGYRPVDLCGPEFLQRFGPGPAPQPVGMPPVDRRAAPTRRLSSPQLNRLIY